MINFVIIIFVHFRAQLDFLTHLAKFQSITNIRSHFILTLYFREFTAPLIINIVPSLLLRMGESDVNGSNIPHSCSYNNNQHGKLHEDKSKVFVAFCMIYNTISTCEVFFK